MFLDPHKQRRCQLADKALLGFQRSQRTEIDHRHAGVAARRIVAKQNCRIEHLAGIADAFVFQQAVDQLIGRAVIDRDVGFLFVGLDFGQHRLAFEFDQRTGHVEKIGDVAQVEFLQQLNVFEVLLDHPRDRQSLQTHFLAPHQVQQQVDRTAIRR